MPNEAEQQAAALERLSALVDGELDVDATSSACTHWRESSESRSSWHAYHLIGDVLRSDDLACDPASDVRFLEAFRARMASEPVVLAPRPLDGAWAGGASENRLRYRGWMGPSAVAAGFVVVAGALLLTRAPSTSADRPSDTGVAQVMPAVSDSVKLVAAPVAAAPSANLAVNSTALASEPQIFVANGQLIRDARLDRYLAAHKQFAGSSALGVPSGFMRNATADATDR